MFFSYTVNAEKKCLVTSCGTSKQEMATCPRTLSAAFMKNLRNVQGTSKAKCKEIFLRDLRKAMHRLKGYELKEVCNLDFVNFHFLKRD